MDITPASKISSAPTPHGGAAKHEDAAAPAPETASPEVAKQPEPMVSPVVAMDTVTGAAILEFKDKMSGQTDFQIPSRSTLQYEQAQGLVDGKKTKKADE